ncbi:MAG: hypothetical protein ABI216_06335, partial [Devosia sp.]
VGGKAQRAAFRAVAGDLKLAYAQFEELETFARFGAHLDDDTRKTIEHGKRIRVCLKQNELSPVSVPEQITILLALSEGLMDQIPVERMAEAEDVLCRAAVALPAELQSRFETAKKLSDADRGAIVDLARKALQSLPRNGPSPNLAEPSASAPAGPATA